MSETAYFLGIDSGLTVTKAVIFDVDGHEVAAGTVRLEQDTPHPRWVERDMMTVWDACQQVIRQALDLAGLEGSAIAGIGVTAHGDGLYLVDEALKPVRPGILSLDTRAYDVIREWRQGDLLSRALALTGQHPHASAPSALLAWLRRHEPANYRRIRWVLTCKDWIRLQLTGQIATDITEASVSFTDVNTQRYNPDILQLYGIAELADCLPPAYLSTDIVGQVTADVAEATGLRAGTPVVAGMHDVDASAIGAGCSQPGQLSMTAGTYSINQIISDAPVVDERWMCRNFVTYGRWMNMSISPASATNLDWFVRELYQGGRMQADAAGEPVYARINREIEAIIDQPIDVFFLPFIFGSPHSDQATAGFFGLRGWHTTAHMLRAVFEGVAFNHRTHIDALRSAFAVREVRVTGGASRSSLWCQIFAGTFGLPVVTTQTAETGALGTAICAGLGTGHYASLDDAIARMVQNVEAYMPVPDQQAQLTRAYEDYMAIVDALMPVWARLDRS